MGDMLGYIRVRVDRSKPLSEVPEVYLDRNAHFRDDGANLSLADPPGTVGRLYLYDGRLRVLLCREIVGVDECVVK